MIKCKPVTSRFDQSFQFAISHDIHVFVKSAIIHKLYSEGNFERLGKLRLLGLEMMTYSLVIFGYSMCVNIKQNDGRILNIESQASSVATLPDGLRPA